MKTEEAKQQFIKAWQAKRNLRLLGMLTDSQHSAIHTKILKLRHQYNFDVTSEELDSDLHHQQPAMTEEQPVAVEDAKLDFCQCKFAMVMRTHEDQPYCSQCKKLINETPPKP